MARKKSKGRTANPKFKGAPAAQIDYTHQTGQNVGGLTDAQVRNNVTIAGQMLHKQLARNKSTGMKVPRGR